MLWVYVLSMPMIVWHDVAGIPPTAQGVHDAIDFAMKQLNITRAPTTWQNTIAMMEAVETELDIMPQGGLIITGDQGGLITRVRALTALVRDLRDQARADAARVGLSVPEEETLRTSLQKMHVAISGTCARMSVTELKEEVDAHLAAGSPFQKNIAALEIFQGKTNTIVATINAAHLLFWPGTPVGPYRLFKRASVLDCAVKRTCDMLKPVQAELALPVKGTLASIEEIRDDLGLARCESIANQVDDLTFDILAPCDFGVITGE